MKESKIDVIATLLSNGGNLRKTSRDLGCPIQEMVHKWYKEYPGLKDVIETAREKTKERRSKEYKRNFLATIFYNECRLRESAEDLGFSDEHSLASVLTNEYFSEFPLLKSMFRKVREKRKEKRKRQIISTIVSNDGSIVGSYEQLGYRSRNSLSVTLYHFFKDDPTVREEIQVARSKKGNYKSRL